MQEKFKDELQVAIKAKDSDRTGAIRILIGEFQRQREKKLSDDQVIAIIRKLIKSEKELLAAAGKESSGFLTVMEGYLPRQAGEEEIRAWIKENVDFESFANPMQAMRPVMNHFSGRADGNTVKKILMACNQ
ncbi:GatB/YqeY domain-containing protein [Desulfomarina sp.]